MTTQEDILSIEVPEVSTTSGKEILYDLPGFCPELRGESLPTNGGNWLVITSHPLTGETMGVYVTPYGEVLNTTNREFCLLARESWGVRPVYIDFDPKWS